MINNPLRLLRTINNAWSHTSLLTHRDNVMLAFRMPYS
jgi:hypothetical protein